YDSQGSACTSYLPPLRCQEKPTLLHRRTLSCLALVLVAIGGLILAAPGSVLGAAPIPPANPSEHWAFQPVRLPAVPAVRDRGWVRTPIDAFLLARLEAN